MSKGYIIHYPGCIMAEVEPVIELLRHGTDLKIATLDALPKEIPNFVLIPGGSCDLAIVHSELHTSIRNVDHQGGLLAAICNGALVLASAGILGGHHCTLQNLDRRGSSWRLSH